MKDKTKDVLNLKGKIERLAPPDPEQKEGREAFYKILNEIFKDKQRNILIQIFGSQIASDPTSTGEKVQKRQGGIEKSEEEEAKEREKARKRYEYIQRCLAKGKIPRVESPNPILLVPEHPPYPKKDIFLLNLWDIYATLKKANLSPIYKNLRWILRDFLNVFMTIDSIKRELSRMRNDPTYQKHMREYVELKIRSRKPRNSV